MADGLSFSARPVADEKQATQRVLVVGVIIDLGQAVVCAVHIRHGIHTAVNNLLWVIAELVSLICGNTFSNEPVAGETVHVAGFRPAKVALSALTFAVPPLLAIALQASTILAPMLVLLMPPSETSTGSRTAEVIPKFSNWAS